MIPITLQNISSYYLGFHNMKDEQFNNLVQQIEWRRDEVKMFGRSHLIPRKHAWYGDDKAHYSYSGITLPLNPWLPLLSELKKKVENITECKFNGVLCNLYEGGEHSNGWHSDDERELVRPITVASLSFGQERVFQLRRKGASKIQERILLENGSLFVMKPSFQEQWQHQIAKSGKKLGRRLNFTFRLVREG